MKIGEQVGIRTGREGRVTFGILDSVEGGLAVVVDSGGQRYERDIKRVYGRERAKDMALVQFQRDRKRGEERRKRMATKAIGEFAMTYDTWKTSDPRDTPEASRMADAMVDTENSLFLDVNRAVKNYGRRVQLLEVLAEEDGEEFAVDTVLRFRLCGHEASGKTLAEELRRFAARLEAEGK